MHLKGVAADHSLKYGHSHVVVEVKGFEHLGHDTYRVEAVLVGVVSSITLREDEDMLVGTFYIAQQAT